MKDIIIYLRKMKKQTLEEDINRFIEFWGCKELASFMKDVFPLLELYDVDENDDWVKDVVGESNLRNVRLIRTVYLMSKFAEFHAGKLCLINMNFKNLWRKMECANAAEETVR